MIKIKVTNNIDRFINKCINNNIDLYNIKESPNTLFCNIKEKDLEEIKKINYYSKIEIIKYYGIKSIRLNIKKYFYDYILLIIFLITIYLISNIVISIEIMHEDQKIKETVSEILKEYNIKKYTIKKELKILNNISDKIINKYNYIIDWISINSDGMHYKISVEERIINEEKNTYDNCHIISSKDAIVTKLIPTSGVSLIEKGSHVHKGDILISGSITLNEEIKDNICASGDVYGETWYKVHVSYPLEEEIKEYTGKYRYNFKYNDKYLYKKNYDNYTEETIFKYKNISIVKQSEYKIKIKKYNIEEAKEKAILESKNKILKETGENSHVISENVLKETHDYSKIELDIFISIEQLISKRITYEAGEANGNDTG